MARKKRVAPCPRCNAESGSGRWMLTYLDMVTLLFGVFIILYAMSKPDAKKFDEVAQALKEGFANGGMAVMRGRSEGGVTPIQNLRPQGTQSEVPKFTIHQNILEQLKAQGVVIKEIENGYHLVLEGDMFFGPGEWKLNMERARTVLQSVSLVADAMPDNYLMEVVGNTDNTPVGPGTEGEGIVETNWELSVLRAASVANGLQRFGVDPSKLKATGRAEYAPAVPNINNEARAQNRRVDIYITGEGGKLKAQTELESGRETKQLSGGMANQRSVPAATEEAAGQAEAP